MLRNATDEAPMDATFLIGGADFGRNDTRWQAWKGNPTIGAAETDTPEGHSNYCAEVRGKTFDVYQELEGLRNGDYVLSCQGFYTAEYNGTSTVRNARLYANEQDVPLMRIETAGDLRGELPHPSWGCLRRREDSDAPGDLLRMYEIAGLSVSRAAPESHFFAASSRALPASPESLPSSMTSSHFAPASLASSLLQSQAMNFFTVSASLARLCLTEIAMPRPYSALSSNREFAHDGPLPSLFVV